MSSFCWLKTCSSPHTFEQNHHLSLAVYSIWTCPRYPPQALISIFVSELHDHHFLGLSLLCIYSVQPACEPHNMCDLHLDNSRGIECAGWGKKNGCWQFRSYTQDDTCAALQRLMRCQSELFANQNHLQIKSQWDGNANKTQGLWTHKLLNE